MTWACVEANPFSGSSGNYLGQLGYLVEALEALPASGRGFVSQLDATTDSTLRDVCVSTDPPYYDNVAYADLSDFFYVWLRIAGRQLFPDLFSTLLVPKQRELIAEPARHASRDDAKRFFEEGLGKAFEQMKTAQSSAYPSTVFYAFKQSEATERLGQAGAVSTGWETMLEGLLSSGLQITATWPIRTEQAYGLRDIGRNSLASSIVLACRPRGENAPLATRKELMGALRSDLPEALKNLQHGNIAPVDLAQASIGPGMAVFSRYSKVLEADGSRMTVRAALALINQVLDEILAEQEGEFDADTRWAIAWFQEVGTEVGAFGRADVLARAKNTSVEGMVEAGIVEARAGKVRLLLRDELDVAWDPATDKRLTVWEMTQHLIRRLDDSEAVAAALARQLGSFAEVARDLAYRLYLVCEREKWSQEGVAYNGLVVAWPSIMQLAASEPAPAAGSQTRMNL
jgi:putative DNA methylase